MSDFISGKGSILNGSIRDPEDGAVLTPEMLKQALEGIRNWHYRAELVHVEPLTCNDLQEIGLWDCINCCPGCHEEKAEGYNPMLPGKLADGRRVEACCSVAFSDLLVDVEW